MSHHPKDKILNGTLFQNENTVGEATTGPDGTPTGCPHCGAGSTSLAMESFVAQKDAFAILGERYNKLKMENINFKKRLQLQMLKNKSDCNRSLESRIYVDDSLVKNSNSQPSSCGRLNDANPEPLSASTLINELEQLREKMDRLSREAQLAELNDLMGNVIPKLKEFERQISNLSDESLRSLTKGASPSSGPRSVQLLDTSAKSLEDKTLSRGEGKGLFDGEDERRSGSTGGKDFCRKLGVLPGTPSTGESSTPFALDFLSQSGVILISDLEELRKAASDQSVELEYIREKLRQQNEKLKQMQIRSTNARAAATQCIPQPSSDGDWSLIVSS